MEPNEAYELIKGRFMELSTTFRAMATAAGHLALALETFGAQLDQLPVDNAPASVEPSSETEPCPPPNCPCAVDCILVENHDGPCVDGSGSDIATAPIGSAPEMAVYAPSTVPPAVELPPMRFCDKDCCLLDNHDGPCLDAEDAAVVNPEGMRTPPAPVPTKRTKNEYTAKEWGHSSHFLAYMKKAPFAAWTAEQQNAKRDAFVAAMPPDLKMNRWGERFAKFCGVAS